MASKLHPYSGSRIWSVRLVRLADGDFYLHDALAASDEAAKHMSEEIFEDLLSGDATEEDADVSPGAWCIVKPPTHLKMFDLPICF